MRNKTRNNELVARAFELLSSKEKSEYASNILGKDGFIDKAYASQIAAFSVSVAMVGLKPTLAIYYQKNGSSVDTHNIVGLIAQMLASDGYPYAGKSPAECFFKHAVSLPEKGKDAEDLRQKVIDNAVALKVVVRTFLKGE